jgi:2,3-bisphosphoglycerate-independent phosphoglycerate mutase
MASTLKKGALPKLKLIYVVIDGLGDLPAKDFGNETPLGAAKTPNMDNLAKHGKTGLMYTVGKGIAPESDVGVISILGYDPFKYSTGRGILEAVGAGLSIKNGDLALRCNFATLSLRKRIIDRRAGRDLTSKEAAALANAINKKLKLESYPTDFEFKSTVGYRGVLVMRSHDETLSSKITNTDPAYSRVDDLGVVSAKVKMVLKKCAPLDNSGEAKVAAKLVNEFVEKSHKILDQHEVNQRRVAEGKLKANLILTRDAGHLLPSFFNINKKYNLHFACLADMPVERGISKLAGMHLIDLPPPSGDLKRDCLLRVRKLLEVINLYDCFYVHIKGPDEPAHDGNFKLKTQMVTTIDQSFLGELLQKTNLNDYLICVTADHATPCKLKAHSDDPVPLLISGNKIEGDKLEKFSEKACRKGSLGVLEHGSELMPQLMDWLKRKD